MNAPKGSGVPPTMNLKTNTRVRHIVDQWTGRVSAQVSEETVTVRGSDGNYSQHHMTEMVKDFEAWDTQTHTWNPISPR